jgi:hypothetical protein
MPSITVPGNVFACINGITFYKCIDAIMLINIYTIQLFGDVSKCLADGCIGIAYLLCRMATNEHETQNTKHETN